MKLKYIYLFILPFVLFFSCKPKDEILSNSAENKLFFSTDTVIFDTVFTETLSITKRLKVTNPSSNAVTISNIYVNPNSPYSIIINGEESNSVDNLYLRGGDSFLVLVKVVLGKNNVNGFYIVEDSIQFLTNTNEQSVKLISWGRDAEFHSQSVLTCDEVWTSDKPHVIYDFAFVQPNCKLTIMPGTEVYVHSGGFPFNLDLGNGNIVTMFGQGLLVGGTLEVKGTSFDKVIFTDDRLEEDYDHRPGLWGGIQFLASSIDNLVEWAEISNAVTGLYIAKPSDGNVDLSIKNTFIRDMRSYGLLSYSADVDMENTLITNCGQNSTACYIGGTYNFNHCTFAEYQYNFTRSEKVHALSVSNYLEVEDDDGNIIVYRDELSFNMQNSIVWGEKGANDDPEEVQIQYDAGSAITDLNFGTTNIIMSTNSDVIVGSTINEDPKFDLQDTSEFHYNYRILSNSPAINSATPSSILDDLDGVFRTDGSNDIGAYEFQ